MTGDPQTFQNTKDIAALTTTVTELATMFRYAEERNKDGRDDFKAMIAELKGINDKMAVIPSMQVELTEIRGEVGKWRYEIDNLKAAQLGLPMLKDLLGEQKADHAATKAKVEVLETWKNKDNLTQLEIDVAVLKDAKTGQEGTTKAVRTGAQWFWNIFGDAIKLAAASGLTWYFVTKDGAGYTRPPTYTERSSGAVSGE